MAAAVAVHSAVATEALMMVVAEAHLAEAVAVRLAEAVATCRALRRAAIAVRLKAVAVHSVAAGKTLQIWNNDKTHQSI